MPSRSLVLVALVAVSSAASSGANTAPPPAPTRAPPASASVLDVARPKTPE